MSSSDLKTADTFDWYDSPLDLLRDFRADTHWKLLLRRKRRTDIDKINVNLLLVISMSPILFRNGVSECLVITLPDRTWHWQVIFAITSHVICSLTDVVQVYTMTTWSVAGYTSWYHRLHSLSTSTCDDDDRIQLFFDCKKCVTTAVRSGTWEQARSFWHRRLDEFPLSLIFRVCCNLAPCKIKKEVQNQESTDE